MKYTLIQPPNPSYSALQQVLTNRGIPLNEIDHYINTTDEDINSFLLLGEEKLKDAATLLVGAINQDFRAAVIVDSDDDGFTSAAILINYLYDFFPNWVENNLIWFMHKGKQHGLNDCVDWILQQNCELVLVPDGGSNDLEAHKTLKDHGIQTIVLDHHEINCISEDAIVINIQATEYPNKQLSGAGVIWQFCRYLDSLLTTQNADKYLDLVALGLTGDMMSLLSLETRHLINKGFDPDNICNPFIYTMWQKNHFKLGDYITSWGATFYIVPFVNAINRSGTQEEKELIFESMLTFKAFEIVPSTKRGHLINEQESKVEQAVRTCVNVKNRQGKAQDNTLRLLEQRIQDEKMLNNKVLLFLLNPDEVDKNIAGLVANKFMAKYQHPCCILTKVEEDGIVSYQGSARGCDKVGVTNFKDICAETGDTIYEAGHQGAFGLGIRADKTVDFINHTNQLLASMPDEPVYYVDYIYHNTQVNPQHILDIADMDIYWGKDVDESLVAIQHLKITEDMVFLMSPDKNPTLKIILPNQVTLIKFGSCQEEYDKFVSPGYVNVNIVGKCAKNEWNNIITPQILIEDYDIIEVVKYFF